MLDALEKDYERIDGKEVLMSPISRFHSNVGGNLYYIIRNYLKGKRCKVYQDVYVRFDEDNFFAPDIMIVCDRSKEKRGIIEGAPDFVAEILSPATRKNDIGKKKDAYERFGVKEYWIVHPREETIDVYLLRDGKYVLDNSYHNYTEEEKELLHLEHKEVPGPTLKLGLYDDFELDIREIFED